MAIDGTAFYVAITSMMLARTFHLTQDAYFFAAFIFAQFLLALTGIGFIAMPSMFVAFGIPEVPSRRSSASSRSSICAAQPKASSETSRRRFGSVEGWAGGEKTYGSADT